ncbi:MAG: hypothetical protein EBZ95_15385, partial [Chitinophagia bacterium]|nr:hypothetical protein [Chitinophagia bacterium]
KIKLFEIFGSITADNCKTMSNSQSGRCNLFEKALGYVNEDISGVVLQSQCNHQMGKEVSPQISVASGNGAISERPTLYSKYCWGLTRNGSLDLNPKAICQAGGKFSLNNPFQGKKQEESTRFKYSASVGSDWEVGRHEIYHGIVKEIFFNYGDLRIEHGGAWSCVGKWRPTMCDSHVALFKENAYNYDNGRRLDELQWGQIKEDSGGVCSCWDAVEGWSLNHSFGDRTTSYHINLIKGLQSIGGVGNKYFNDYLCKTDSNPDDGICRGFSSTERTDPQFDFFSNSGEKNILSNYGLDISAGHHKSLRIIMWGCPDNYSTTYDYNANKCIGIGDTSFNPSSFYPSIPADLDKKCSQYSLLGTNIIDPLDLTATSIDLKKGSEKTLACKSGYGFTLAIGQTSPKIRCSDVDSAFINAAGA